MEIEYEKFQKLSRLLKPFEAIRVSVQLDDKHHTDVSVSRSKITCDLDNRLGYFGKDKSVKTSKFNIDAVIKKYEARKEIWENPEKAKIIETKMYDDWNDRQGVRVSLEDIDTYIIANKLYKSSYLRNTRICFEDYDDYGCEYYLLIPGSFANLKLEYKCGNCEIGADCLICTVVDSVETGYKLKKELKEVVIYDNYEAQVTKFIKDNEKYIECASFADAEKYFTKEAIKSKL